MDKKSSHANIYTAGNKCVKLKCRIYKILNTQLPKYLLYLCLSVKKQA